MIHVDLHVSGAEELEALAEFAMALAAIDRTRLKDVRPEKPIETLIEEAMERTQAVVAETVAEVPVAQPTPKKGRGRPKKSSPDMIVDEPKPAISTGEARVGPEDAPEVQAQDAADEQAESAATKPVTLTHDDVRHELGVYVKQFGMEAAQADGPKLFTLVFPDRGIQKISDIPDDQDSLAKAVAGVKEMTAKNPYERTAVL